MSEIVRIDTEVRYWNALDSTRLYQLFKDFIPKTFGLLELEKLKIIPETFEDIQ